MRTAVFRAHRGVAVLAAGAALAACARPLPGSEVPIHAPIRAPDTFTVAGERLVFEEDPRTVQSVGFVAVGDGLLGEGSLTAPRAYVFIGPHGHVEAREGPLRFAVNGVDFDSRRGSTPRLWGRWPGDYFAEAFSPPTRQHELVRVRGADVTDEGPFLRVLAILPWTEGRTVGVIKDASGWKHIVWDAAGRHDTPLPGYAPDVMLADSVVVEGEKGDTCSDHDLVPWAATMLPSGEMIVLGRACSADPARQRAQLVIDRWSADGATHAIDLVPTQHRPRWASFCSSTDGDVHVVMSSFEERILASVGGGAVLATRGASGWTLATPLDDLAESVELYPFACAVAADGSTWLNVTHDTRTLAESKQHDGTDFHRRVLKRLSAGGRWSKVVLPSPWTGGTLLAGLSDGSVWLRAGGPSRTGVLLRLGDGEPYPLSGYGGLHPLPEHAAAMASVAPATPIAAPPAKDPCAELFVRFYTLGASTPDDYEFPQTRRAIEGDPAIAGARFVTAVEAGRRVFGAILGDRARAEQIAALLRRTLPGSAPRIACGAPTVLREHAFRAASR